MSAHIWRGWERGNNRLQLPNQHHQYSKHKLQLLRETSLADLQPVAAYAIAAVNSTAVLLYLLSGKQTEQPGEPHAKLMMGKDQHDHPSSNSKKPVRESSNQARMVTCDRARLPPMNWGWSVLM